MHHYTLFTRPFPQFIQLANNQISKINLKTFATLELELFNLAGNSLNVFPIEAFKKAQFRYLFLQSNELVDLDVEKLLNNFPRLNEGRFIFGDNNIACSRMEEINYLLKRSNIIYQPIEGFDPYYPKTRYYDEDEVEGLPCIPEKAYSSMFFRKLRLEYETSTRRSDKSVQQIEISQTPKKRIINDVNYLTNIIKQIKK